MFEELISNSIMMVGVPMSEHTTFKVGGPAAYFAVPENDAQLKQVVRACRESGTEYFILGNGSNLLVSDKGYDGCVISMKKRPIPYDANEHGDTLELVADAGFSLGKIAMEVSKRGYAGFEFATGIPGSVGGAVVMNAGAYGGEIKDCLQGVEVLDDKLEIVYMSADKLDLSYRHSIFSETSNNGYIVLRAFFKFEKGDEAAINMKIAEQLRARRDKQPITLPSAGSTFKRPEGHFAGKLIMDSGLSGFRVGGACVSEKHCGFIVNDQDGTAGDVWDVICHVKEVVFSKFGVELEPEVRLLGEF